MKSLPGVISIMCAALIWCGGASASSSSNWPDIVAAPESALVQFADSTDGTGQSASISEDEAANIAQGTQPGAKVLKVKLLPSGVYAVTLKEGGNVSRVMVDANTGAVL